MNKKIAWYFASLTPVFQSRCWLLTGYCCHFPLQRGFSSIVASVSTREVDGGTSIHHFWSGFIISFSSHEQDLGASCSRVGVSGNEGVSYASNSTDAFAVRWFSPSLFFPSHPRTSVMILKKRKKWQSLRFIGSLLPLYLFLYISLSLNKMIDSLILPFWNAEPRLAGTVPSLEGQYVFFTYYDRGSR